MSSMSAPPPYAQRSTPTEPKAEDCRDYLRTGRCKYGASCKYNHPSNVQSGGGMKAPIDPSEPLFPVRLNEPVCQYYMKHGTCKFGQACKFNHPTQTSSPNSAMNGNTAQMGVGRKNDVPQMLWSSGGGDSSVHILPQRPDEPNCIFFLKNGRCKYGSTCRYHHPLNYHDRRQGGDDGRRQHIQVQHVQNDSSPKIHYVTSLPPGSYQQGHFVVADGSVTFLSIDGSTPAQVISVPQGNNDGAVVYSSSGGRPLGLSRELASSSSSASLASSYETANSNLDSMGPHGDSSSSLWNRPKKSPSANSLNAYNIPEGNEHGRAHIVHGSRSILVQNGNDSNMSLPRVVSSSSAGDGQAMFYDANSGMNRQLPVHSQSGHGDPWRGRRANSFDHTAHVHSTQYNQDDEYAEAGHPRARDDEALQGYGREAQRSPMMRGRPPPSARPQRRPQQNAQVDDGLSMMTSALLTMLDTPQEAQAAAQYEGYDPYDEQRAPSSQNPQMHPQQYLSAKSDSSNLTGDARQYLPSATYSQSTPYYDQHGVDDRVLHYMPGQQNRMDPRYDRGEHLPKNYGQNTQDQPGWSPNWQGSEHLGRPLQENAQSMPVVQSQTSSNSPHSSSHVGLYLS